APALALRLGQPAAPPLPAAEMLDALAAQPGALGILPFDALDPRYKVIKIEGLDPLSNRFDPQTYPLTFDLTLTGPDAGLLRPLLAGAAPLTNRDPSRLTQLIMTGVTAMSRGTAEKMEQKGYVYPARVISDTLAAADITHVSNEVPFIQGCRVNNTYMNLVLCSDYPYWAALEAIGVDIVGLSGNHVNDFGRDGARESIAFYRDRGIPIYGSGLNTDEACAPLLWQDHGNTFAFIAALAWWPETAWATDTQPGACYFYDNYDRILADIRRLSAEVDIVAVELQYHETYNPWPIPDQVAEFRDLRSAGADIVTGVQSHVPQAVQPGADTVIFYGLGNLFFDQMQSWETRTGLIARHTIYEGRLLSAEILTTVLEDFAQPRWATADERAGILRAIFAAAPPKDALPTPQPPPPPPPPPPQPALAGPGRATPGSFLAGPAHRARRQPDQRRHLSLWRHRRRALSRAPWRRHRQPPGHAPVRARRRHRHPRRAGSAAQRVRALSRFLWQHPPLPPGSELARAAGVRAVRAHEHCGCQRRPAYRARATGGHGRHDRHRHRAAPARGSAAGRINLRAILQPRSVAGAAAGAGRRGRAGGHARWSRLAGGATLPLSGRGRGQPVVSDPPHLRRRSGSAPRS
ncbi:MAG: CapA family protein, partial [Caldilineales bacterium]|nr:CapA family protein [Caldilineales bacterium]